MTYVICLGSKTACGMSIYHFIKEKFGLTEAMPDLKCALKVWMALSAALHLWKYGGTNW